MTTPSSDEINSYENDLFDKSNELNRVDSFAFNLLRVKADINYFRAYLFQLMNDVFGLSESCREKFEIINKKIEELTQNEIFEILQIELEVDESGSFFGNNYCNEFYHFADENFTNRFDYSNYPELFTNIKQVSYDQGGLIVFELYGTQIYKLFNSKGKLITGPCHDLDILINGKFIERSSDNSGGFHLSKYSLFTDSVFYIKSFSDFDDDAFEFLSTNYRDRIQIEIGKSEPKRIENFKTPESKNEAKIILLDTNCNWITSPELVKFYENDKELALLAISREPLAYSLLSEDLMIDKKIQKTLCLRADWNLLHYVKEWNFDIENLLTFEELREVITNNTNILSVLSKNVRLNKDYLMAAMSNSISNINYADDSLKKDSKFALEVVKSHGEALKYFDNSLKANREIVFEAIKNNCFAIKFCSESLRNNEDFIVDVYEMNPKIMSYIDDKIIKQHERLRDLFQEYESRKEDFNDLPF
jgi:hypothetical protein